MEAGGVITNSSILQFQILTCFVILQRKQTEFRKQILFNIYLNKNRMLLRRWNSNISLQMVGNMLLFFVFIALPVAQGLYFHIAETERKCFIEEIPDETMVIGN